MSHGIVDTILLYTFAKHAFWRQSFTHISNEKKREKHFSTPIFEEFGLIP